MIPHLLFRLANGTTVPPVVETEVKGGGKKRHRSKYPRRVMIDGVLHWVRNAEEERQLLQAMADRAKDAAKVAEALGDEKLAKQARKKAVKIARRREAVDTREDDWLARLLDEDEEILMVLQ